MCVCVCVQKGDIVQIRRMSVGEGWWEGELNGFRGLFPSAYVKLVSGEKKLCINKGSVKCANHY